MTLADDLIQVRREALAPPPSLSLAEWSDQYARIPAAGNASPGRWRAFQYQREWLDAISDPAVHEITVMKSARVGYTRVLLNAICFYIHQDPSPILAVFPRVEDSEDFSRSDLLNTLLDTPVTAALVGDVKSRDANQRILKRTFKNGSSVTFVGANSPAGFRRISARIIMLDEVDGFPLQAGSEGDQISLARKRGESYWSRKLISGSTPTIKYESRIEKAFNESDKRRYHIPCPHCGHFQVLRFKNLQWDKTPTGEHLPDSVFLQCEKGCIITEDRKPGMIEAGRWIAERPFNGHAGFAISSLYSQFFNARWSQIVREFLAASKDETLLRTFTNATLGESWEERGSARPWEELAARARSSDYKRGTPPKGAALLFLGCDFQLSSIEWMLTARGSNNKKYIIDYGVIRWPISEADGQRALNALLRRRWNNYAGLPMSIVMTACDAGYETSHVLEFTKGRRDVIAVRGVSGSYRPSIAKVKSEKHGKRGDILKHPRDGYFVVGIDSIKSQLFVDLAKDDADAAGYIAFPSDCEDRLFQELTAEHRVQIKRMGMIVHRWEKASDRQANELLDCYVYSQAAMARHGCNWISAERWAQLEAQCSGTPAPTRKSLAEVIAEMPTYG